MGTATALGTVLATSSVPIALIDRIILDFHIGQILVLVFVLTTLGVLPFRSRKLLSINIVLFGLIFVMTPFWVVENYNLMMFAGIAMIFIGTMLYVFSDS